MKVVELYGRVRYAVQIEGLSRREAARQFGIDPRTVAKMLSFSVPPGYRRSRPPARPKLDPFIGIIDRILVEDEGRPKKQRHTSKRIFERLRDEHGYADVSVRFWPWSGGDHGDRGLVSPGHQLGDAVDRVPRGDPRERIGEIIRVHVVQFRGLQD